MVYKKKGVKLIIFLILSLFSACATSEHKMTIVVLYDVSASMPNSGLRGEYIKITDENILPKFCSGDRLLGATVTDNPFRDTNFSLNQEITPFRFLKDGNEIKYAESVKKQKEDIKGVISNWFNSPPSAKTCLVDTIKLSENAFNSFPNPHKSLVIFSDMLEYCNGIDFEKKIPSSTEIETTIKKIEETQGLPALKGVDVYIIGASGGLKGDDNSNRYNAIKQFWTKFLEKSGATVRYGQPLNFRPEVSECSLEYSLY